MGDFSSSTKFEANLAYEFDVVWFRNQRSYRGREHSDIETLLGNRIVAATSSKE